MNKQTIFYTITSVAIIIVVLVSYFQFFSNRKDPIVLGSSINDFYAQRKSQISKPPKRILGAEEPIVRAESAILMLTDNKYPLYEKNSEVSVPVASITKVMTALVALDLYENNEIITVKKEAVEGVPTSKIFISTNEKISFESLFYGMLMASGNDAARAIAVGKMDEADFLEKMNEKALALGMNNTKFYDPAGLSDEGRSTAKDVAIMFSYALKNQMFAKVVSTPEFEVKNEEGKVYQLKNSNRLITGEIPFEGQVLGGKTGLTEMAGHTLVCAATREGKTLISVILKTFADTKPASAEETKKLLDWGFDSYTFN